MRHDVTVTEISSWQAAEAFAATYLKAGGHSDARTTVSGADGGVDVMGARVLAQVKYHRTPVGRPDLQRLFGARGGGVEELYFFSLSGYSPQAIQYAKQHGIGLLSYTAQGHVTAHTSVGGNLAASAARHAAEADRKRQLAERAKAHMGPVNSAHLRSDADFDRTRGPSSRRRALRGARVCGGAHWDRIAERGCVLLRIPMVCSRRNRGARRLTSRRERRRLSRCQRRERGRSGKKARCSRIGGMHLGECAASKGLHAGPVGQTRTSCPAGARAGMSKLSGGSESRRSGCRLAHPFPQSERRSGGVWRGFDDLYDTMLAGNRGAHIQREGVMGGDDERGWRRALVRDERATSGRALHAFTLDSGSDGRPDDLRE